MDLLLHNLRTGGIQHDDWSVAVEAADEIERLREALRLACDWLPYHEPDHPDYEGGKSDAGRAVRLALDPQCGCAPSNVKLSNWPEGLSDGLTLPCGVCGQVPSFDYSVTDDAWNKVVPPEHRLGVVCLPCLDRLACHIGEDISAAIWRIQFTGLGKTVVFEPVIIYRYVTPNAQVM